jgi:hypothetical protein
MRSGRNHSSTKERRNVVTDASAGTPQGYRAVGRERITGQLQSLRDSM